MLALWAWATLGLSFALAWLTPSLDPVHALLEVLAYLAVVATAFAPVAVWLGRALESRDADARRALVAGDEPRSLAGLGPGIAALVHDARLLRSALEFDEGDPAEFDAAVRALWEWLRRLDELPAGDRAWLADIGADAGLAETLRVAIAEPRAGVGVHGGAGRIVAQLEDFERRVCAAGRGPYR